MSILDGMFLGFQCFAQKKLQVWSTKLIAMVGETFSRKQTACKGKPSPPPPPKKEVHQKIPNQKKQQQTKVPLYSPKRLNST